MTRHIPIPDLQIRPDAPMDMCWWIGEFIADKKPDVVVQIGDLYDMHSLSSYDKGKKSYEGRRYKRDIEAGNVAFAMLNAPIAKEIARLRANKKKIWTPELHFCLGNHEARIERVVNDEPMLDGAIGYQDFEIPDGWVVHPFLEVVWLDGFAYSHYFQNQNSARPIGGTAENRLSKLGCSFFQGHEQGVKIAVQEVPKGRRWGFVHGAAYLHDESYRGRQSNREKRGIVVLNEVEDGDCDPMLVSLNFLCKKYEGVGVDEFVTKKYGSKWAADRTLDCRGLS